MYQVLYRKWRPKKFEDVVGQTNITKTLRNEIIYGHIAHAYLFTGSRGTGKTTCARIFSLAVNCQNPISGNPCGLCDICKGAESDALLDISEIDAASNNGVENIRSIKEEIFLIPNLCKYRVYIIDESHMLSSSASNALLKMLEEPPSHVIFILATTEAHKIPATISSRCQRFEFHRIHSKDMIERIKFISNQEKIEITDSEIKAITELADGSMRDALSLLDRCVSCVGKILNGEDIQGILGITDSKLINEMFKCIVNSDSGNALRLLEKLYEESRSMIGLCENILDRFRQEMMQIISNKDNIPYDKLSYILKCMGILQKSYRNMVSGSDKKVEMEIAIARMCFIDLMPQENNTLKIYPKTAKLLVENKISQDNDQNDVKDIKNLEINKCFKEEVKSNDLNKEISIFEEWPKVLKYLIENAKSKAMIISLKDSKAYKKGNVIFIDSDKSLAFSLLKELSNKNDIDQAFREVMGQTYKIEMYAKNINNKKEIKIPNGVDPLDKFAKDNYEGNIKFE